MLFANFDGAFRSIFDFVYWGGIQQTNSLISCPIFKMHIGKFINATIPHFFLGLEVLTDISSYSKIVCVARVYSIITIYCSWILRRLPWSDCWNCLLLRGMFTDVYELLIESNISVYGNDNFWVLFDFYL